MTRHKIRSLAILLCILCVFIFLGLTINNYVEYEVKKTEWEQKTIELAKTKADIQEKLNSIEQFEQEKAEFEQYLFGEQDIPAFLDGIAKSAQKASIQVVDMQTRKFVAVQPVTRGGNYVKDPRKAAAQVQDPQAQIQSIITLAMMPINVKVQGTYQSFIAFLNELEDFEQLLTISEVSITSGREYPLLNYDFTLKIYSLKTLQELATK